MTEIINKNEFLEENIPVHLRDAQKKAETLRKKYKLSNKKQRVPLKQQKKIGVRAKKGYYTRLVNDVGDRIANFLQAGYSFREDVVKEGNTASKDLTQSGKIACQQVGAGIMGYYLDVPQEWKDEDDARKQAELDERERAIGLDKLDPRIRRGTIEIKRGPLEK